MRLLFQIFQRNHKVNLYPSNDLSGLPTAHKAGSKKEDGDISTELILSVLGQRTRLQILRALVDEETGSGVTTLSKDLSVKAPTVEKHLATLRKIGLVKKQVTLDLARERWMIRGRKRVSKLLDLVDSEIMDLVLVGHYFEQVEKAVRQQQYYREHAASVQEMDQARKDGDKLDILLERVSTKYATLLDEDEQKKLNYWISARGLGVL
jgi:DNA-binding transcriptional ArsR family regulator